LPHALEVTHHGCKDSDTHIPVAGSGNSTSAKSVMRSILFLFLHLYNKGVCRAKIVRENFRRADDFSLKGFAQKISPFKHRIFTFCWRFTNLTK
jgi:hypothetical protein